MSGPVSPPPCRCPSALFDVWARTSASMSVSVCSVRCLDPVSPPPCRCPSALFDVWTRTSASMSVSVCSVRCLDPVSPPPCRCPSALLDVWTRVSASVSVSVCSVRCLDPCLDPSSPLSLSLCQFIRFLFLCILLCTSITLRVLRTLLLPAVLRLL